jgi:ArsR family transcriptional regulator
MVEQIDVYQYNPTMDRIFKSLADKNRRKILTVLNNKEMSVNEMLKYFDITQATLSNHLSILKKVKLVECKIDGKQRIYRLNKQVLEFFVDNMNKFIGKVQTNLTEDITLRRRI